GRGGMGGAADSGRGPRANRGAPTAAITSSNRRRRVATAARRHPASRGGRGGGGGTGPGSVAVCSSCFIDGPIVCATVGEGKPEVSTPIHRCSTAGSASG